MKTKYEILSDFLFPKFSHPKESRFIKDFTKFSNKKITNNRFTNFTISLEKIKNGEDKRTSIIIKNIPNSITKENIREILKGTGNINYLYVPFIQISKKNLGFAIINLVNYKSIINLYNRINEYKFNEFDINKSIEISYYKIQGKVNLSKMFVKK